jgi:excisionase family DNA binding protein
MSADLRDFELALMLGKHPRTIQRWCAAGKLPGAYKAGRSWRIPRSALTEAGLPQKFAAESIERHLKAATDACKALTEELQELEREGRLTFPRDWNALAQDLRALQESVEGLPERASKVPKRFQLGSGGRIAPRPSRPRGLRLTAAARSARPSA